MTYVFIILIILNAYACCLMGIDKRKSIKGNYRIPEKKLLISAIPFSSFGFFLGMKLFRHKTTKLKFHMTAYLLMIIHVAIIGYIWLHYEEMIQFFSI